MPSSHGGSHWFESSAAHTWPGRDTYRVRASFLVRGRRASEGPKRLDWSTDCTTAHRQHFLSAVASQLFSKILDRSFQQIPRTDEQHEQARAAKQRHRAFQPAPWARIPGPLARSATGPIPGLGGSRSSDGSHRFELDGPPNHGFPFSRQPFRWQISSRWPAQPPPVPVSQ